MSPSANPAAGFYAAPALRLLALLLRGLDGLAPQAGARLALRFFLTPRAARAPALPAGWRMTQLPFEGQQLALWQLEDAPADASPVLLVHGWAGDASHVLALAEGVRAAGFRPLLLELPAHGRSGFSRSNAVQWTRALFAVSSRHGPWHAVVGHSLGALAVAHALARGLPAQRAALLAVSPPPRLFMGWFASVLGLSPRLAERMGRQLETNEGVDLRAFEPAWLGPRLHQPLLLVHDRDDRTAPLASARALAEALPAAELHVTQGLGHRRLLGDAAVVRRVVGFLDEASGAPPLTSPGRRT